ncbi:hypothetical protein ASPZODRAFT_58475 [Penicilliopsis zonata CBS 506.65]|uniref:Spindle pole body component n=1 Tax=Penicilliopsis zonata CBS 506.65 TaxID=1073090 RepID=A0A1L9SRZ6_9EURO|nr:hypothetical protein ASPZODRAFT_58475 [Penicilliopsis zonata CBS 506.65]OJJ49896.1 hypothetical protein ASPZODRAFT_58475 [Penicilliopsis zonata CBS 506.65]
MEEDAIDPFSSESLWQLSRFTLQSLQPLEPLPWASDLSDPVEGPFQNPLKLFEKDDSTAFPLDLFANDGFVLNPPSETTDTSSEDQTTEASVCDSDSPDTTEDLWSLAQIGEISGSNVTLRSWETCRDPSFREPISAYFSESGARGFDAALAHQATKSGLEDSGRLVRTDVFLRALFQAGLGWESMFFRYNGQQRTFEKQLRDIRITGVSLPLLDGVIQPLLRCGGHMHRLRDFVRLNPITPKKPSVMSTLASAIAVVLYTLERQLSSRSAQTVSLLQIMGLFQRPAELVGALADMVGAADKSLQEAHVISIILKKVDHFSQVLPWAAALLYELVARVIAPWLSIVEAWIGLCEGTSAMAEVITDRASFVEVEEQQDLAKSKAVPKNAVYNFRPDMIPSFIPAEQALQMFESGRSLRLLKWSHPDHPIANPRVLKNALPPKLHCAMTWIDIERIQSRALDYERKLRAEIQRFNRGDPAADGEELEPMVHDSFEEQKKAIVHNTFEMFEIDDEQQITDALARPSSVEKDSLSKLVDSEEETTSQQLERHNTRFGPELPSALYLSLAPVLSSQALLIDFSCLHLLFKEHKLRIHLTVQWRFHLLGDGSFASLLSHSLFDPEMESGERKAGVVRSSVHTGLRLGSRDTWPPASSELRLVLIGLLNECHAEGTGDVEILDSMHLKREKQLPGGLSFAIRELTAEEIIKVKNPNAIEALDFLRLQYKPPDALDAVITPRSLNRYDRLFKHLLRLLRMVSVVKGLVRDSTARGSLSGTTRNLFQKFRIDAQHFVLAFSDYSFHVGVGSNWQRFQDILTRIEACLDCGDIDGTIEAAQSVPRLRDYHEDVLDQILFALFLSRRHIQAAKLLEEIFGTVLAFAPLSRLEGSSGIRHENEASAAQLYILFRKQVAAFVGYLRTLDGGKAASSKSYVRSGSAFAASVAPTSIFEHLLARLDVKQYY